MWWCNETVRNVFRLKNKNNNLFDVCVAGGVTRWGASFYFRYYKNLNVSISPILSLVTVWYYDDDNIVQWTLTLCLIKARLDAWWRTNRWLKATTLRPIRQLHGKNLYIERCLFRRVDVCVGFKKQILACLETDSTVCFHAMIATWSINASGLKIWLYLSTLHFLEFKL